MVTIGCKSTIWAKEVVLAYHESLGIATRLAWSYEGLGLTEDADYWAAVALAHASQPEQSVRNQLTTTPDTLGSLGGARAIVSWEHATAP